MAHAKTRNSRHRVPFTTRYRASTSRIRRPGSAVAGPGAAAAGPGPSARARARIDRRSGLPDASRGSSPTGSARTLEPGRPASAATLAATVAGAAAALHVPPYYNRPNQDGIYAHLAAVADLDIPIILYNVPSRTITDIAVETMARLARLPNVVAVKDATGNLARVSAQRLACGEQFVQLSGNDDMALGFNAMGGTGCISVSANVAPRLCSQFQEATREGRWDEALELQDRLYPLHAALFSDASPGPVKYALSRVRTGFPAELRAPLTEPSAASKAAVDAALAHAGLA